MRHVLSAAVAAWCCMAVTAWAQTTEVDQGWRAPGNNSMAPRQFIPESSSASPVRPVSDTQVRPVTQTTRGSGTLPHTHGQVWREYDISPYTSRVSDVENPEKAIVDWILRDTGSDVWFSEPLGILSATGDTLRVYHTPEMQQTVSNIVDRFVHTSGEPYLFSLRTISISSPNWRVRALPRMRSVAVQSPGVEAWLVSKEDATLILADLSRRKRLPRTQLAESAHPQRTVAAHYPHAAGELSQVAAHDGRRHPHRPVGRVG